MSSIFVGRKPVGIVLIALVGAAAIVAALLTWGRPNGRAEAADIGPAGVNPQVSISDDDLSALAALRQQVQENPHTIDPDVNHRILTGQLDGILQGPLSDRQRAILADGVITFDEYRTAESQWRTCVVDAGLSVPPLHLNGIAKYNDVVITGGTDRDAMNTALYNCSNEYTSAVSLVWAEVTGDLVTRLAQVETKVLGHCVDNAGFSVDESQDITNLPARRVVGECIQAITQATDTVAFYGEDSRITPPKQ